MTKLSEISCVKIGYNFRRERDNKDTPLLSDYLLGGVPIVQFRDVVSLCHSSFSNLQKVQVPDIKDKYYLSMNEILLSNKGEFQALVWKGQEKIMASSAFYRIKICDKNFLPEYVALYLNSVPGKAQLCLRQNTVRISTITISDVKDIDIPLIPMEKQRLLVDLFLLYERESSIMEKIRQNRQKLINSILSQTIKE